MPKKSTHEKGWKSVQSKKKLQERTKTALFTIATIILLIIFAQLFRFTKTLFTPWRYPTQVRNYSWDGKFNLNLIIRTNSISILSFNPREGKAVIVNIPSNTYLQVPHGFGGWQLRSIYELGVQNKGGDKLLKESLIDFLGLPIDGFLDFSGILKNKSAGELVEEMRKGPLSGFSLLPNLQSDLTLGELIRLKFSLASVRFDKIRELDLFDLDVLEKTNLLDGSEVFIADFVKLDSVLSILQDPTVISEHKSIAVLNTTDHPQLAQKWARLITNLGGNVIITSNAERKLQKTQIFGAQSATLTRLKQIFGTNDKISSKDIDLVSSRAQINLLLGEDYIN